MNINKNEKRIKPNVNELKKGIYIFPSIFTCGNMAFGILSIMSSIDGWFIRAAWLLTFALVCDILDGRIARMTHTTSDFGLQLDSLSDLISFGTAPAMMIYMLVLKDMEKTGIAIAILYVLCCALRLARYNVMALKGISFENFKGLPSPASAGVLISFVLSYELLGPEGTSLSFNAIPILMQTMPAFFAAMPVIMVVLSFLMVSNVPYYSFKQLHLNKTRTIRLLVLFIVLVILIIVFPQNIFFIIFIVYAISGFIMFAWNIGRKRKKLRPGRSRRRRSFRKKHKDNEEKPDQPL